MEKYDLIVIGSGPAGQRAAIQASKFGKKAALIEKMEVVGGVSINTGTIPSKTMREAVLHLSGYNYQNIYGVNYRVKEKIRWRIWLSAPSTSSRRKLTLHGPSFRATASKF